MSLRRGLAILAACVPAFAWACDVPDEGGNTPWRRAVSKVRYLPDVETWAIQRKNESVHVQYVVLLDAPRREGRQCWWPVEVRAEGKLWRRFLVTPDGRAVKEAKD